jgi:hypothetical protein
MVVRLSAIADAVVPAGLREVEQAGYLTDFGMWDARLDTRRYHVLRSRDNIRTAEVPDWRWHVSVSGERGVPRWRDLVAIGHELRPGVCFVVGCPPKSWWINVHPHCLHLYETKDENLIAQWRFEGQGHTPS